MKKNNFFAGITALIFSVQVCAYVPLPPPPDYKNCPIIQSPIVSTNPDGTTKSEVKSVIDPGCVKSENQKYSAIKTANAMANNLNVDSNNGVQAPVQPIYQTCVNDPNGNLDYACLNDNAAKRRAYDEKLSVYNMFKDQEAKSASQQQAAATAGPTGSATQLLAGAEANALAGQKDQSKVSSIAMGASITLAGLFAASCLGWGASCQYKFAIGSAAAALLSFMTAKQASKDASMAFDACQSYNQMASEPKSCGAPPPPFDPEHIAVVPSNTFPYGQVDKTTGQCLPSAPATCKTDLANLNNKGVNIQDVLKKGPSAFAGPNAPFKLNPNGTVTMKDGKTYKPEDFASKESMIAAGMSPADAGAVAKDLFGKDGVYAKAGIDAKAELNAMPKSLGSFDMGAGGSSTVKGAVDQSEKLGLGTKDDSAGANGSRKPTNSDSEGLVKDFNGDSIGISKDDIFKMMNKRYILKSAQDSFIGQ